MMIYTHDYSMGTIRAPTTRDPTSRTPSLILMCESATAALADVVGGVFVGLVLVVGVGGEEVDGVVEEPVATVTPSFIPPEQWPAVPQTKYLAPALSNVTVLLPPLYDFIALLVEQAS